MLAKINRLKKKKDFEKVFRKGKGIKEDFLYLKFVKNNLKISRFGFIVSKKISNKAVIRNKIRRRLSEIIRLKMLVAKKGIDVVVVAMPGLAINDFWDLEGILGKVLGRAGLLENKKKI